MAKPYPEGGIFGGRTFGGKKYRYSGWWLTKRKAREEAKLLRKRTNAKVRVVPAKHAGYNIWVGFK